MSSIDAGGNGGPITPVKAGYGSRYHQALFLSFSFVSEYIRFFFSSMKCTVPSGSFERKANTIICLSEIYKMNA